LEWNLFVNQFVKSDLNELFGGFNIYEGQRPDEDECQQEESVAEHRKQYRLATFVDQRSEKYVSKHVTTSENLKKYLKKAYDQEVALEFKRCASYHIEQPKEKKQNG
jgi:hypothetical protein